MAGIARCPWRPIAFQRDGERILAFTPWIKIRAKFDGRPAGERSQEKVFLLHASGHISQGKRADHKPGERLCFFLRPKGEPTVKSHYPGGYSVVPRPVFGDEMIYAAVGMTDRRFMLSRLMGKGTLRKPTLRGKQARRFPTIHPPYWFGTRRQELFFMAADRWSGQLPGCQKRQLKWMQRAGSCSASLLHAGGRIY